MNSSYNFRTIDCWTLGYAYFKSLVYSFRLLLPPPKKRACLEGLEKGRRDNKKLKQHKHKTQNWYTWQGPLCCYTKGNIFSALVIQKSSFTPCFLAVSTTALKEPFLKYLMMS